MFIKYDKSFWYRVCLSNLELFKLRSVIAEREVYIQLKFYYDIKTDNRAHKNFPDVLVYSERTVSRLSISTLALDLNVIG